MKHLLRLIRGKFPSALPKGTKEFEAFSSSIFETYHLPNLPSYEHAIATMIMHLGPQIDRLPKSYFARSIRKAMANEVAYSKLQEIREIEKKKEEDKKAEPLRESVDEQQPA